MRTTRRQFVKAAISTAACALAPNVIAEETNVKADAAAAVQVGNYLFSNPDEELYPNRVGNFSKSLPHTDDGVVVGWSYNLLLETLKKGPDADFERIALSGRQKLANPQAAYALEKEGYVPKLFECPPYPEFASEELATEVSEIYWQSLLRDIPFAHYPSEPLVGSACTELSALTEFRGPRQNGRVTPATLFRGNTPGDVNGPYVSQFLYRDIPFGATKLTQRYKVPVLGDDHMTNYAEWLEIQRGYYSKGATPFDPVPRHLRTGRDLSEFVRRCFPFQEFLGAALIMLGEAYPKRSFRAPFGLGHPYLDSDTQTGFATFGAPYVLDLVTRVANFSLKACWHDKWLVHRRIRPEEFGGRIHNQLAKKGDYPFHKNILGCESVDRVHRKFGTWLLPQAYPDGCPIHPSYSAGHAVSSGACATILKALFDDKYVFPEPLMPSEDGTSLVPYKGKPLTVGGEIDKLAGNISLGRNFAGIHWRSDMAAGLRQGELVALQLLREQRKVSPERSGKFTVTTFAGEVVQI